MITHRDVRQREVESGIDSLPDSIHPVIRRILLARNISAATALDLQLGRMQSPAALSGITDAAEILAHAVVAGQRILIVGDFDADGATGTAVAVRALQLMGASEVGFRVPNRFEFGYGLSVALVETLADEPPDVLVTVDSGISSNAGVARARELGCKVVVTDHHLPGKVLPQADAIVNPNCPGDRFSSKALAGVGVVFYLMSMVRTALRSQNWFTLPRKEPNLAQLLDLVALGTVADLVALDDNNRILVRQGMDRIRRGRCSTGLLALLRLGKRDYRHLVASDLAFAVAPRLNAAGRMQDMGVGIRCLLTDDREEAMALATELDELNHHRRARQEQMQEQALDQLKALLESLEGADLPAGLCLHDGAWHQGIVGLVAARIKDAVHRPVIAFAPGSEDSDVLKGSARSVSGLHIRDVLARVDALHPDMIMAFGGHAMAAGLTLPKTALEAFTAAFNNAVEYFLQGRTFNSEILTDGELEPEDINLEFAQSLRNLGPWGQHFPEPVFSGRFVVEEQRVVGGAHLKMMLRPVGGKHAVDAIAFGKLPEDLPGTDTTGFVYRLDINHFRGRKTCQLMVEHILR
ncbi:MAG: single-stranded-DNA-specific exonuclease RecJ [Gammaproteobacteria bacterium]|nr:MAG: single-stranded-DNA-specific exonuclease RecJ [Gammaproteobacteria bacterium]